MEEEIVLTVTSKDSMEIYPRNTIANFRSKVDLPLDGDSDWECCVHSVSYVKSWYNALAEGDYWMEYQHANNESLNSKVRVIPAFYERHNFATTVQTEGMTQFHNTLTRENRKTACTLAYDTTFHRFKVVFYHTPYPTPYPSTSRKTTKILDEEDIDYNRVIISRDLANLTGFSQCGRLTSKGHRELVWENFNEEKIYWAEDRDLFEPTSYFWLQSSIIKPTHNIGGSQHPVLALVPVDPRLKYGERTMYTPIRELWFPMDVHEKHPRFVFTDEHGKLVSFNSGTSTVQLRCRRVLRRKPPSF